MLLCWVEMEFLGLQWKQPLRFDTHYAVMSHTNNIRNRCTYYPLSNISTSRNKHTSWQNLEFLSFVHHGINIHHGKMRCRTSWMYVVLIKYGINVHHGLFWITYVRTSWNKHRTSWKLMNSTASVHVLLFDSG